MGMWEEVLICARQTNRSYNRAPRDSPSASFTTEANQMRLQLQIFLFLTHSLLLPPSLYATSLIFLSFRHSSPLLLLLSSASQWVWALGGKEGVIWSLWALIKTSVWISGISCADVWVAVYFSVVLWLHDNLPLFFLSPFSLSVVVFLRASMKHPAKTSECFALSLCYQCDFLLLAVDWQSVTVAV